MYLVICNYDSDSERKRIEYVFSKSSSEADDIRKIEGITRIINENDIGTLLSDLYLRTSAHNVSVYKISKVEVDNLPETRKIKFQLNKSKEAVDSFINYLLAQKKAIYKNSIGNTKYYESATRRGYAQIRVNITETLESVEVQIEINSEEPNRSHLINFFTEEIELFG